DNRTPTAQSDTGLLANGGTQHSARPYEIKRESADKPGSVEDSHSSRANVTIGFKQPTRTQRGPRHGVPIWSCSEWGLPCHALLPGARCALTAPFHPYRHPERCLGGLLSAALSVGSRRPGVTWHSALWSPDFPPPPALPKEHRRRRLSSQLPRASI